VQGVPIGFEDRRVESLNPLDLVEKSAAYWPISPDRLSLHLIPCDCLAVPITWDWNPAQDEQTAEPHERAGRRRETSTPKACTEKAHKFELALKWYADTRQDRTGNPLHSK
jgi:hypothetical protein